MSGTESHRAPSGASGFVLLIVLMVLVALSTTVIISYDASVFESVGSRRQMEQIQARSLAEGCLDRAMKHARSIVAGSGTPDPDLDRVLDPDVGATPSGDEYIPATNDGVVYVPNSGTAPLRRFALLRDEGGSSPELNGGGCLIRYDDNMDDSYPGLNAGTSNNTVTEGDPANQVLWRDRDGVITVTAIGLYPVKASTPDAEAYERAHARSTLKGLVNVEISYAATTASLMVQDTLVMDGGGQHNAVCGAGGATYNQYDNQGSADRLGVCGQIEPASASPLRHEPDEPDSHMCPSSLTGGAPCEPQTTATIASQDPTISAGTGGAVRIRDLFGVTWGFFPTSYDWKAGMRRGLRRSAGTDYTTDDPYVGALGPYPGGGDACAFYYMPPGQTASMGTFTPLTEPRVFVWDYTEDNASDMTSLAEVNMVTGANTTNDCSNAATAGFDMPCDWVWNGSAWDVICSSSTETPCWKLVAVMDGNEAAALGGTVESTKGSSWSDEVFHPVANRPVPFITGAADWNALCQWGGPAGTNTNATHNPGDAVGDKGFMYATDHWEMKNDFLVDEWPGNKAIHIMESTSVLPAVDDYANRVQLNKKIGDSGGFTQHAFIVLGAVDVTDEVNNCCPRCDCASFPPADYANPPAGAELWDTGYFLYAYWHCSFNSDDKVKNLAGDVFCKTVHVNKRANIVGDLFGYDHCRTSSTFLACDELEPAGPYGPMAYCDTSPPSFGDDVSVCVYEENNIVGGIFGLEDVAFYKDNTLTNRESFPDDGTNPDVGVVNAGNDIWMSRDNNFIGRVLSRSSVGMDKHNRIFWPGATPSTPSITNIELKVSEETW